MNLVVLTWNIRGIGKPKKLRSVIQTVKENKASVVFLQETKISKIKYRLQGRLCGHRFGGFSLSPAAGASGGLISMWDTATFSIERQVVQDRVIILVCTIASFKVRCVLVNVYAPNDSNLRSEFLDELTGMLSTLQVPIIVGEDFNTIKTREEKKVVVADEWSMRKFNEFINSNELIDLPMDGNQFTWFRGGSQVSPSKSDRFLVSTELLTLFPNHFQTSISRKLSDHTPVILKVVSYTIGPQPFKWFSHWADERAKDIETVESIEKEIDLREGRMVLNGDGDLRNRDLQAEIRNLKIRLWARYRRNEKEWLQKSRLKWFKEGGKNTKFFHVTASVRNKINFISHIRIKNKLLSDQKSITRAIEDHFRTALNKVKTLCR
ncbi:hypothetical protein GQ457_01G007660 [Hibiscus cannabinus]